MASTFAITQQEINQQVVDVGSQAATWGSAVSLGLAAFLCVAFLLGFILKKL